MSAELAARYPAKGGIYYWVTSAFGHKIGFLAVWLQWINTMVWYPTILSFIAATAVYLINPHLAQNKFYLISVILSVFWILTLINLKGIQVSAKFNSICALIGTALPMILIVVLGLVWLISGKPLHIHFTAHDMLPTLSHSNNWISLTAIITAFLGMELTAVHINHIKNPQKTYPEAVLLGALLILITMMLGSLAIAIVLPVKQINLVDGTLQAFDAFFHVYHLAWIVPVIGLLILIGSIGGMINWVVSPAKGLLQAGAQGYLPKFLIQKNKHDAPHNILVLQAVVVSIICLAFLLMPSVNGSYWLLTDLSTELYLLMYILLFLAAIAIQYKNNAANTDLSFRAPYGLKGMWIIGLLGLTGCIIAFIVGFFPPDTINVGGVWHYEKVFAAGIIIMILPVAGFYYYQQKLNKFNN